MFKMSYTPNFFEPSRDCDPCSMTLARPLQWKNEKARVRNHRTDKVVQRGMKDENSRQSYAIKQAAQISVESRVEERRKNTMQKPFSAAAKVKSFAVWWTNSEASNANYERQTIASMTTSIKGDVRTSRKTNGRCQGRTQNKQGKALSS